jgi:hypothetical protein
MGYRHLAKIGHGTNNRPIYHRRSAEKLTKHEQRLRERLKMMMARKVKRR